MRTKKMNFRKLLIVLLAVVTAAAYMPAFGGNVYADTTYSLKLTGGTTYQEGDPIYVYVEADASNKSAWVGLYKKDEKYDEKNGGVVSLRWDWAYKHAGSEVDITADALAGDRKDKIIAGDYKVILFGDEGFSTIKDQVEFTVEKGEGGSDAQPSDDLSLELVDAKASYIEDEPIYVRATGTAPGAWVGIYGENETTDPNKGGSYSYRWFNTADQNGEKVNLLSETFDLNHRGDLPAGNYKIILFGDGMYSNVVKTIPVTITMDPNKERPEPSDELTLKLIDPDKTTYKVGEEILIRATGDTDGSLQAWVGLYKEGDTVDPGAGGVPSLRWFYTKDHNGEKLNILETKFQGDRKDTITQGKYNLILFGDNGYSDIKDQITITIDGVIDIDISQFSLETDKTDYMYGDPVRVRAKGTGLDGNAWVGLYNLDATPGANAQFWYYVKDYEDVFTTIQGRNRGTGQEAKLEHGAYKIVLFADGGYDLPILALEKDITVTRPAKSLKHLRDPGCTTYGLEFAIYDDNSSEFRIIPTLGGHDWNDPVHIDGTDTHKYVCKRNDKHTKIESCSRTNEKVLTAATTAKAGEAQYTCDICSSTYTVKVPKLYKAPTLSETRYVYNGKTHMPTASTLVDENGKELDTSCYTISYPKKSVRVGVYTVKVKLKGVYAGTYNLKYKIVPKAVKLKTVKKGKKSFTAKWSRNKTQTGGYQIAYSTNKNFKGVKYKKVKKAKKTSLKVKKLKSKKTYYVKVRAFKKVNGKTCYSSWSNVKKVRTK